MASEQSARDYWRYFASEAETGGSPLYAQLSRRIGDDPFLQALSQKRKKGQPPANLLFGAVHFLLLGGMNHRLVQFYPHITDAPAPVGEDPFVPFRDFCVRHEAALSEIIATRVTNTNEVRRCVFLVPGLVAAGKEALAPLHLIEVGPSAGLNLVFDRYRYRYQRKGADDIFAGAVSSALTLETELRGELIPALLEMPNIARRLGLELNPVDLALEEDRRWLLSLLWPGRSERFARMKVALAIAAGDPPVIRAGNALALLPVALGEVSREMMPVVMHSFVTYQFSADMKTELSAILDAASRQRPVLRLSCEYDGTQYPLVLARHEGGKKTMERTLATVHAHGDWISWT